MSYKTYLTTVASILIFLAATLLTHVIYCIQTQQWGLLIAGAVAPPIGVVHGLYVWISYLWSLL